MVAGLLFIILYYSDSLREVISNLGVPSHNFDIALWIGIFFIVFGIILIILKVLREKIIAATENK